MLLTLTFKEKKPQILPLLQD